MPATDDKSPDEKNYDKENLANDPQLLELKREELRYKKEQDEKNNW